MPTIRGDEVHGEVSSTDAHTGTAISFYNQAPALPVATRTILATEFVTITDVLFISTAGGTYEIVFYPIGGSIVDAAGLRVVKGNAQALGGIAHHFETPITGPVGYIPALIAAVGQVDLIVSGYVSQG
jgi:hypothetical protein